MSSGQDLILELQTRLEMLDKALRQIKKRGEAYARAEQEYRVALAQQMLCERDRGTPVTILSDICRGNRDIAKKRFDRDTAESVYKAALEACNVYKIQIRVLENQIEREWGTK